MSNQDQVYDIDEIQISDLFNNKELSPEQFAEACIRYQRELELDIDKIEWEVHRLRRIIERKKEGISMLKTRLMTLPFGFKYKSPIGGYLKWTKTTAINIIDESLVPERFKELKTESVIKKKLIDQAFDNKELVPGAERDERTSVSVIFK